MQNRSKGPLPGVKNIEVTGVAGGLFNGTFFMYFSIFGIGVRCLL